MVTYIRTAPRTLPPKTPLSSLKKCLILLSASFEETVDEAKAHCSTACEKELDEGGRTRRGTNTQFFAYRPRQIEEGIPTGPENETGHTGRVMTHIWETQREQLFRYDRMVDMS